MNRWTAVAVVSSLLLIGTVAAALPASADMFEPSNHCRKPYKPFSSTAEFEIQTFRNEVRAYRACIERFVEEQEEAAAKHKEAARQAIDEWNSFARRELD